MPSYLLSYGSKRTFVDTNSNNNMGIEHWICYNLWKYSFKSQYCHGNKQWKSALFHFSITYCSKILWGKGNIKDDISDISWWSGFHHQQSLLYQWFIVIDLFLSIIVFFLQKYGYFNICISQYRSKSQGRLKYVFVRYLKKGGIILERERRSTIAINLIFHRQSWNVTSGWISLEREMKGRE